MSYRESFLTGTRRFKQPLDKTAHPGPPVPSAITQHTFLMTIWNLPVFEVFSNVTREAGHASASSSWESSDTVGFVRTACKDPGVWLSVTDTPRVSIHVES